MPVKNTVLVACRLPSGLILHHPKDKERKGLSVKLNGVGDSKIIGSTFATTEVDADFWSAWKAAYSTSPLMESFAVFEVKNEAEAAAKAKELRSELTGFEQMSQSAMGVEKAVSA